jgi:hypothetical protein
MKKISGYIILLIVYVILFVGCEANDNEGTEGNVTTFSKSARSVVLAYYSNMLVSSNIEYKQVISIFAEEDINNDKLILGSYYLGMGQENCNLFHIVEDKKQATIQGIAIGEEPLSMGYSVNIVILDDKTVIFGTLSDEDYDYVNDVMKEVNYTQMEAIFEDGLSEKRNIDNQDGYILVGETTSKIEKIILYERDNVSVIIDEFLESDNIVNRVEFSKETQTK